MTAGIILAGGRGRRFGAPLPKQFLTLAGLPVIEYSILKFVDVVDQLVIVCHPDYFEEIRKINLPSSVLVVAGGKTRQLSVLAGMQALEETNPDLVAIHDGARPLFSKALLIKTLESAKIHGSGVAATPATQTLCISENDIVQTYIPREHVRIIQTPQSFEYAPLHKVHQTVNSADASDDSQLWMSAGQNVVLVEGETSNIKITHQIDLDISEKILETYPHLRP